MFVRSLCLLALLSCAAVSPQTAQAGFVFTIEEVNDDVVVSGSGSLDTSFVDFVGGPFGAGSGVNPEGFVMVGPDFDAVEAYSTDALSGPAMFGPGVGDLFADTGTGDRLGF